MSENRKTKPTLARSYTISEATDQRLSDLKSLTGNSFANIIAEAVRIYHGREFSAGKKSRKKSDDPIEVTA